MATVDKRNESVRSEADREEQSDTNRAVNFGGPRVKLYMEQCIEGYHLVWEAEEEVESRLMEGFSFVSASELPRKPEFGIVRDEDVGDRVARSGGKGVRLFLMKCPKAVWKARQDSIHEEAKRTENEIFNAYDPEGSEDFYQPKGVKSSRKFMTRRE